MEKNERKNRRNLKRGEFSEKLGEGKSDFDLNCELKGIDERRERRREKIEEKGRVDRNGGNGRVDKNGKEDTTQTT